MMILLRDDTVIQIFESPEEIRKHVEAYDVNDPLYQFCDDSGQRYIGVVHDNRRWFRHPTYELPPVGDPDVANALALLDQAEAIELNPRFPDLATIRDYLINRRSGPDGGIG